MGLAQGMGSGRKGHRDLRQGSWDSHPVVAEQLMAYLLEWFGRWGLGGGPGR